MVSSKNGLLRCVIWPESKYAFEGRAFLTDLSPKAERQFAERAHALCKTVAPTSIDVPKPSDLKATTQPVPPYAGDCVFESERLYAKVTFSDFGLVLIDAIILGTPKSELSESDANFTDELRALLDEIVKDSDQETKSRWKTEGF